MNSPASSTPRSKNSDRKLIFESNVVPKETVLNTRSKFLKAKWPLFLVTLTIAGTLATGLDYFQGLLGGCDFIVLIGLASMTAVCLSRLISPSLICAFTLGAVVPSIASAVSAGLYVLYVPPPPGVPQSIPNDMSGAILDGVLAAVISFPVGCVCAVCCVFFLKRQSRVALSKHPAT